MQKTVMNKKLAQALMEAGMEHFDVGGSVGSQTSGGLFGIPGALTAQNEYSAVLAPQATTDYRSTINGASANALSGYDQQQAIQGRQQQLEQILGQQAIGGGLNPAQLALAQNTGNNISAQAALMAGQRGAGANVGQIAKQAAQQGGAIQQQANSDAARLQADQQLAAQRLLSQQQAQIGAQNIQQQQTSNQLYQAGAGAQNQQNQNQIQNYGTTQGINADISGANAKATNDTQGGILKGISKAIGLPFYKGGEIPSHLKSVGQIMHPEYFKEGGEIPGQPQYPGNNPKNDTELALMSPGEVVLPNTVTQSKNAPSKAAEFMRHIEEKKKPKSSYKDVMDSKTSKSKGTVSDRLAKLEKLCYGGVMK